MRSFFFNRDVKDAYPLRNVAPLTSGEWLTDEATPHSPTPKRWKQVSAGIAALFSSQLIGMVGSLAVVPVFLSHWSAERYGEWLALSSLVAYLSTLDLGMNMAGCNRLTQEYARGDMSAYRIYLRSAMAFYLLIAGTGSIILLGALELLPISHWLGLRATSAQDASTVALLIGLQVLWSMPVSFVAAIYRTTGNLARTQWVRNGYDIAVLALTVLLLVRGAGMIALALLQLLCLVASAAFVIIDLRKRHPGMLPGVAGARFSAIRELVRPSLYFALMMLGTGITVQGPVLLMSAELGGAAVALFVSTRTLANLARQIVSTVSHGLWPHVTALDAQRQHLKIRQLHRIWLLGSTTVCASIAAALWFEGAEVIRLWTRGRLSPDPVLLHLILIQLILQVPWQASSLITGASNQHSKLGQAYLWSSVLAFGISAALIKTIGAWAIPIGWILGEGIACYHFVIHDTCQKIGEPYGRFARKQWSYLGLAFGLTMLFAWIAHNSAIGPALLRWTEVGTATVLTSATVLWTVGLGSKDRRHLLSIFHVVPS